jgi:DNA-binding transcriptional ArsR family regulator
MRRLSRTPSLFVDLSARLTSLLLWGGFVFVFTRFVWMRRAWAPTYMIVFDAVMEERNVTRAGGRIGLSQPAVSHALSRLRYMLKDELFIRAPQVMRTGPEVEKLATHAGRPVVVRQGSMLAAAFHPEIAGDARLHAAVLEMANGVRG